MEGFSRQAFGALRERLGAVPGEALPQLAEDLFAVTTLLDSSLVLRRALSEPSTPPEAKANLVRALLQGKIGEPALALVIEATTQRWSSPRDLGDVFDAVGTEALLASVEDQGSGGDAPGDVVDHPRLHRLAQGLHVGHRGASDDDERSAPGGRPLDEVEDELFRFGRLLDREAGLELALSDPAGAPADKSRLLHTLLDGKAQPASIRLLERLVLAPRGRTLDRAIADVGALAAARRQRLVATVRSARPLDAERLTRLAEALHRLYGRAVQVQLDVDPSLVGGLTVRVGDELVDGSIARRLADARAQLTR